MPSEFDPEKRPIASRWSYDAVCYGAEEMDIYIYDLLSLYKSQQGRSASLEAALQKLAGCAENIRHWHDTMFNKETKETEGMVVSSAAVFALWEALSDPIVRSLLSSVSKTGGDI